MTHDIFPVFFIISIIRGLHVATGYNSAASLRPQESLETELGATSLLVVENLPKKKNHLFTRILSLLVKPLPSAELELALKLRLQPSKEAEPSPL